VKANTCHLPTQAIITRVQSNGNSMLPMLLFLVLLENVTS